MILGYARVSTDGQSLEPQLAALKAAGAESVFSEKVSGAKADRRQLQRAIAALCEGDVLLVTRLDRLARSTRDLLSSIGGEMVERSRPEPNPQPCPTSASGLKPIRIIRLSISRTRAQ